MIILLYILSAIIGLIVLLLIVALFIKKEYTVAREITIGKAKPDVFAYLRILKNNANYNKWWRADPTVRMSYRGGADGQVGFIAAWESDVKGVGAGEQEVKEIREDESIAYEIRFFRPFKGMARSQVSTIARASDQTLVTMRFDSRIPYPMNIMRLFMSFENMLGKDQQESLELLKRELEK